MTADRERRVAKAIRAEIARQRGGTYGAIFWLRLDTLDIARAAIAAMADETEAP